MNKKILWGGICTIVVLTIIFLLGITTPLRDEWKKLPFNINVFRDTIESDFQDVYTHYGAVRTKFYSVPSETTRFCLVDFDYKEPSPCDSVSASPQVCDFINKYIATEQGTAYEKTPQNIFFNPSQEIFIKVAPLKFEEGRVLCLTPIKNIVALRLEGKDSYILVSEVKK